LTVLHLAFLAGHNPPKLVAVILLCLDKIIPIKALVAITAISRITTVFDRLFLDLVAGIRRIPIAAQTRCSTALDAGIAVLCQSIPCVAAVALALEVRAAIGHGTIPTFSTGRGIGNGAPEDEEDE